MNAQLPRAIPLVLAIAALLTVVAGGIAGRATGEHAAAAVPWPGEPGRASFLASPPAGTPAECPVTLPNGETPPGERPSLGYHGNGQLWTGLPPDGRVVFTPDGPGDIEPDGSLSIKWPWWIEVPGLFTVRGTRLDAPAPPLRAFRLGNPIPAAPPATAPPNVVYLVPDGFVATSLVFPTAGCWQVTAVVGDASLSFVTLVVDDSGGRGPDSTATP
ncbi:MAG: hypothetical protein QOF01_2985 [Thermomicrobiales bacterium]|nr:hypothetical protein [Thermomicrobiales bacterium]